MNTYYNLNVQTQTRLLKETQVQLDRVGILINLKNSYYQYRVDYLDITNIDSCDRIKIEYFYLRDKKRKNCWMEIRSNDIEMLDRLVKDIVEGHNKACYQDKVNLELENGKVKWRDRKYMVFVNPNSGQKKHIMVLKVVQKQLESMGCSYDIIRTTYPGFIYDYFKEQENIDDLGQYESILCISGDGIIHELLNCLDDYLQQNKGLVIESVQSGTANALLANISYLQKEQDILQHHMFQIQKGITRDMDLLEVTIDRKKVLCFLSVCHGIICDIDIMSEWLRFLGTFRFDVYGLIRWLRLRTYKAKLYYTDQDVQLPTLEESLDDKEGWVKVEGIFLNLVISKLPMISKTIVVNPDYDIDQNTFEVSYITQEMGRINLAQYLLGLGIKANSLKYTKHFRAKAIRFVPDLNDQLTRSSFYSLDGEKYSVQTIQVSLLQNRYKTYGYY